MFSLILAAALSGATPVVAIAQDAPATMQDAAPRKARKPGKAFAKIDTNGDGKVSLAEYQAVSAKKFAKADVNGDGRLDVAERAALKGKMAQATTDVSLADFQKGDARKFKKADANGDGALDSAELMAGKGKQAKAGAGATTGA